MNAISMLKNDHRKVEKLFREFKTAGDRAFRKREQIARKVCTELEIHSQLEEQLFYPAIQMTADAKGQDLVRAAIKEHHVVQTMIDELNVMSSEAENYGPTFKMLAEHVEHHIREEERAMLPSARDQLGQDGLEYLGDQMAKRRRELTPAHPPLLRDTLRQAKGFVTMAYDALTGAESAKPPARRSAKAAPKRRTPSPKQVVHATAKQRSSRAGAQRRKLSARG
jgi:hemerythrin superfamily protein